MSSSAMDRFNDLQKQGFMRNANAKPKKTPAKKEMVSCNACANWHFKGHHTEPDLAKRKENRKKFESSNEGVLDQYVTESWPSIDHSILSPSGHVSKRTRNAALERTRQELFGKNGLERPKAKQPSEKERHLANAKMWHDLADRGMGVRKYRKLALDAEAKAAKLEHQQESVHMGILDQHIEAMSPEMQKYWAGSITGSVAKKAKNHQFVAKATTDKEGKKWHSDKCKYCAHGISHPNHSSADGKIMKAKYESSVDESKGHDIGDGYKVHKTGMDPNGNYSAWVSHNGSRARKIQTNGSAPAAHHKSVKEIVASPEAKKQLKDYHKKYNESSSGVLSGILKSTHAKTDGETAHTSPQGNKHIGKKSECPSCSYKPAEEHPRYGSTDQRKAAGHNISPTKYEAVMIEGKTQTMKSIGDQHQLKIAKMSMKDSCFGARLGGMSHDSAARVIKQHTGKTERCPDCMSGRNGYYEDQQMGILDQYADNLKAESAAEDEIQRKAKLPGASTFDKALALHKEPKKKKSTFDKALGLWDKRKKDESAGSLDHIVESPTWVKYSATELHVVITPPIERATTNDTNKIANKTSPESDKNILRHLVKDPVFLQDP